MPEGRAGEGGSRGVGEDLSVEGVWVADGEEEGDCAPEGGEEGVGEGRDGYVRGEGGQGCESGKGIVRVGGVCGKGMLEMGEGGWHGGEVVEREVGCECKQARANF